MPQCLFTVHQCLYRSLCPGLLLGFFISHLLYHSIIPSYTRCSIFIQVKKFPSKFKDKQSLKDVLSKLLWLASGYHAAVTFPLLEFSGFLPNAPYRLFADEDDNDVFSNLMFGNKVKALVSHPGLFISIIVERFRFGFQYL